MILIARSCSRVISSFLGSLFSTGCSTNSSSLGACPGTTTEPGVE